MSAISEEIEKPKRKTQRSGTVHEKVKVIAEIWSPKLQAANRRHQSRNSNEEKVKTGSGQSSSRSAASKVVFRRQKKAEEVGRKAVPRSFLWL